MDNNSLKGYFVNLVIFLLMFLYVGGSICTLIFAIRCKALVPIVASVIVILFGVPTLRTLYKKVSGDK